MKRVNIFVDMDAELVKGSKTIESEVDRAVPKKYWKIIRVGNHIEVHHFFDDMLKAFDMDDLVMLWSLVKEKEGNRHLHAGREGVSIVKGNSYIDVGRKALGPVTTKEKYNDAQTLFAAIQTRFGGNEATKKTLLKQMYKNFSAPSTESLDSIFNRIPNILSQLAILGENISQEDLNLKFFRSLTSEWNTHVVV
ncbi:hypothetical protein Tco_1462490 [Tanacetum coccineum]